MIFFYGILLASVSSCPEWCSDNLFKCSEDCARQDCDDGGYCGK